MTKKKYPQQQEESATILRDDGASTRSELELTKEKLRQLFKERNDRGFRGARRLMAPASMQEEITRLSKRLRELKHAGDVARFGRFSPHSRRSKRQQTP